MTTFFDRHHEELPLLLPNAWDVASALAFGAAGFRAIGTTSFGVAAGAGRPDGGRSTMEATKTLVAALLSLPAHLSADIEDGYSDNPDDVAGYVRDLGAAGVNIEDSTDDKLVDPALQAAKIRAIKARAPQVFLNARIDTYWLRKEMTVDATLKRALAYTEAGADGIFIPGATDADDLAHFARAIRVPVNILAHPELTLTQVGALGIRRVSTGSLPYRAALDAAVEVATRIRNGDPPPSATTYPVLQQRLRGFTTPDRGPGTPR